MALFKCKMCGGALEIGNETVATCEYCGTQQTLPRLDDDRRANLYDRANHFRRNNEFDKAMGIYEQILNEDQNDAEAYWSLVLCRYGIEYVEDPTSRKRIPTVNRAQFTSIFDDDNYKSALQYADGYQRNIYQEEAKAINEIQKGILAISQKEEPFDVFICYKETDNAGRRTPDSVLANDLYHQLTQEGFKVFFARITLEDKLGSAYEPYIFAALNSAKVMVVLGTKPEFFNAVWVRNEWSRYLALIKQGQKKMLIPAYKDMDPYDLPEEFSHLQAQDMSKLGFMQDLIRGIKKITQADAPQVAVVKETVIAGGNANAAPLLKRAFMFLEDGDWNSANEYCEKVLDIDPENASAYLGKLLADLKVRKQEALKNQDAPFVSNNNYQKAFRFGDEELKKTLLSYIEHINTRNAQARTEGTYHRGKKTMLSAKKEWEFKEAAHLFESIGSYQDAEALAQSCYEKAEIARKDTILGEAWAKMQANTRMGYEHAARLFESIPGWKYADEKLAECREKLEQLHAQKEAERLEKEHLAEIAREKAEKREKLMKKLAVIGIPTLCAVVLFVILLNNVIIPNSKYNKALALMDGGKYTEAIAAFEAMDGYKDSENKITECNAAIIDGKYNDAMALMDAGEYTEAIAAFEAMDSYKDSENKITECNAAIIDGKYNDAMALMAAGKLDEAYDTFNTLGDYKDAFEKAGQIRLTKTKEQLKNAKVGDYITFGAYEQDNDTFNGKEEIQWFVLEVKDGRALLISKYALDCQPYHTTKTDVTWENCTLRKWLNDDFVNAAFSGAEKEIIPMVTVLGDKNPGFDTDPGKATQDRVFLLSMSEASRYFTFDDDRQCEPTDYADARGAKGFGDQKCCWWWLRTPGDNQNTVTRVMQDGDILEIGYRVDSSLNGVRPAMWIDLNA